MKEKIVLYLIASILLLSVAQFSSRPIIPGAFAAPDATATLLARSIGWNASTPPANPTISSAFLFPGQNLVATVRYDDSIVAHDLAYYRPGVQPIQVSTANPCGGPSDLCLAKSTIVNTNNPQTTLTFAFSTADTFEYYCQIHPSSMHGRVNVFRTPDLDGNGVINIVDLARIALVFGTTPASPNWNPNADLNKDATVNISDLVIVALNFGRIL